MEKCPISLCDVQGIYDALYNDQLEGAYEDYLEEFVPNFETSSMDFSTESGAKSAMRSLIRELEEDRTDTKELFEQYGVTAELLEWLGREDLIDPEKEG